MRTPVELGDAPAQLLLDGALGLSLATGVPLRLVGPLSGADAALVMAAVRLGEGVTPQAVDAARELLTRDGPIELSLLHPRAGLHMLDLREPGAVARALWTLSWPLALLGRPSELRLNGPNHCEGSPTFHELRLAWAPVAAQLGLRVKLDLVEAGFDGDQGVMVAQLDPAPALTPLQLVHRGLLRQVTVVVATGGGNREEAVAAAEQAARTLRKSGINAEAERVPLPLPTGAQTRGRWALTALAEFERSVVSSSALGPGGGVPAVLHASPEKSLAGERVAEKIGRFLARRAALDARTAERLLLPSILCAAGLGARAGPPPTCHYTTSEVTEGMVSLATLARRMLPVRAVVDGPLGEEGVVVVAPAAP
jgi:RNA 3'-terminal phosphate cyclase